MKKILLTIIFSILFISNAFATTERIITPDGRDIGVYQDKPFAEIAQIIEADRNKYGLQDYIYRVYINDTEEFWTVGIKNYDATIQDAYRGIAYKVNRDWLDETGNLVQPGQDKKYEGPNIIYSPTYTREQYSLPTWENTGIKHPYKLYSGEDKLEQNKVEIKPEIIYSPSVIR